jgi:SpoVK/Ycf46/Vps4 family AAA+-type ATPase
LFDEADSFFSNRQNANRAWERTLVNEFLTQMEEFSGILICTTNLRNLMDPAIQRRFHILTEFKPLKKSGVESLLNKYFPEKQFSETKIQELINFNSVTPGDFGALDGRIAFMSPEKVSSNYILNELIEIQKEKCKTVSHLIGFAC